MSKEEQISKIFYEMEEDTSNIDFELNQRNIKRRNRIKEILKKDYISKAEVKEKIEKRKKTLLNQPLRWDVKNDIRFLEDLLKQLGL